MPKTVTVLLDQERQLVFTNRALYRMGTLQRPFGLEDLSKRGVSYAALVAWLWALLSPSDAVAFATPEALAEHVPVGAGPREALFKAIIEAINGGESKNGDGSNRKRSPRSS